MTTTTRPADTATLPVLRALNATWNVIRKNHPEIPEAVIALASGSMGAGEAVWGHWYPGRWVGDAGKVERAELFMAGERLSFGGTGVLETLLHEAAHAVARAREISDTSRGGRYHNQRFAKLAGELGLTAELAGTIGYSSTKLTEATTKRYRAQIAALDKSITMARRSESRAVATGRKSNNNGEAVECACPRKIRVSESTLAEGPILCGVCGSEFAGEGS